jgi:oligo-1,6-glucosidase
MDVINLISKVPGLPDAPIVVPGEEFQPASIYFANGYLSYFLPCRPFFAQQSPRPRVHEFLKEMNEKVLSSKSFCHQLHLILPFTVQNII